MNKKYREMDKTIVSALLTLLQQKSFDELTITEICESASISRKTFYHHFNSKEAILDHIYKQEAVALGEYMNEYNRQFNPNSIDEEVVRKVYYHFFDYWKTEKAALIKTLIQQNLLVNFLSYCPMYSNIDLAKVYLNDEEKDSPILAYFPKAYTALMLSELGIWARRDFQDSIETVTQITLDIISILAIHKK